MAGEKTEDGASGGISEAAKDQADVQKLHSEINQIQNQRFLLTTIALTAFGAILYGISSSSGFEYTGSILLLAVLAVLYLYSHFLKGVLRTYTAYLRALHMSPWEARYRQYREGRQNDKKRRWCRFDKKRHWGYDQGQAMVFVVLGAAAGFYPYLQSVFGGPSFPGPYSLGIFLIIAFAVYAVSIAWDVVWSGSSDKREDKLVDRWNEVLGKAQDKGSA